MGEEIRAETMQRVQAGQLVFSTIRATDGAIGIVPPEFDGALVSKTSYTVFDCTAPYDAAYLWSVLRSSELRADMQSLSPGSGRYTTYWEDVKELLIPWLPTPQRKKIGQDIQSVWEQKRQLDQARHDSLKHTQNLGIESEESRRRWRVSKAPQ